MQWGDITTCLSCTSLPPTNQILSTTAKRRACEYKLWFPSGDSYLSHQKGEAQITYQERFPNQSAHPLPFRFYEFNHMVIKKSESRTESRKVIRVCIRLCGVLFSEQRTRNAKRREFLRTAVYLNRIRLVQNHTMFRATYYHIKHFITQLMHNI